jgi:hypothetical protein
MKRTSIPALLLLVALTVVFVFGTGSDGAAAASVTRYQQNAAQLTYTGTWSVGSAATASGGSYRYANASGMAVTATFNGASLAWISKKGPTYGIANVSLDGGAPVTVDLYNASVLFQQKVWETGALSTGYHTVRIEWTGTKNSAATNTNIGVDAFDVAGTLATVTHIEQTDLHLGWRGSWAKVSATSYSGGTAWYANADGSSVSIEFDGASVTLLGKKGPTYGFADISLDGATPVSVDLYKSSIIYKQTIWTSGVISAGHHVVTLSWTGEKRAAATNTNVGLDALDLIGALTVAPTSHLAFSETQAMAHLHALAVDIGTRHGGSPQEWEAVQYAVTHFSSLGYSPQVTDVPLPDGTTSHNVIITKPGSSNLTIVIGAHMDCYGVSPGGNDNGSGSAAVLELARALKDVDLMPTVVLVLFGHEEPMGDGNADHHHYGSRKYVAAMTADQKTNLAAMISLDMIAAGSTFNIRYMEKGPRALVNSLMSYSSRTGSGGVYMKDPSTYGYSDHEPFELAGYPAAWLEWLEDTKYHTASDTYAHCSSAKIQKTGGMVVGYLASLRLSDLQSLIAAR